MPGSPDDAEAYSLLMTYPSETDYYALLGLPRDPPPTDAAIRSAYRTLTLSFHPDKQPEELREAAKHQFGDIYEAYETLIDPKKRVVYDLLGVEGVRREWGTGGVMGRGGDAEKMERQQQVGVRAMREEEFRRWFLGRMKRRERGVVNSLVKSKGSMTLGINASNTISIDEELGEVYIQVPSPQLSDFAVRYSFAVPFPTLGTVLGEVEKEDEDEDEGDNQGTAESSLEESESPELSIHAGVSGHFKRFFNQVELEFEDGETEIRKIPLPLVLSTQDINLGASISRVNRDKGILRRWPFSFLQNSVASVNATLLPTPSLHTSLAKSFVLVRDTRPFTVVFETIFNHSISKALPSVNLQVTKGIGKKKLAFCNWSSGFIAWPSVLQTVLLPFFAVGVDDFLLESGTSQIQVGIASQPVKVVPSLAEEDEEEAQPEGYEEQEEYANVRAKEREESRVAEAWQVGLSSSPLANGMILKYSRNIFSGKPAEIALSQWSSEKHYSVPPEQEPRSVRLEVTSTVSPDLSATWSVHGSRQVSELTRVGLGVGLQNKGLVMTLSWSRLGQRINLPIAVCPVDSVNQDSAAVAVLLPWLAYCAVEFGFIRPRERRNRRKVIARRQKQLRKLIPQKKAESIQAIELMAEQVRRRQEKEEGRGGLVITKAEYGHHPSSMGKDENGIREPEVVDVTIPVAALVDHGQLIISKKTAKFHILGFHDPAPLKPKVLKIWYQYHGKEHYAEANDAEGVTCPMRLHLLAD
ncbi:hypothetical protein BDW59DRAFT_172102 [Aspergillus cavernicola]|uniref:J domain-containing protein n=1 Tax=Aspergillus cavernicola TaxID=176166 RepID=A0ABR4IFG3_9EURO